MSDFNPGPEWREVSATEATFQERIVFEGREGNHDGKKRYWVREVPVPVPLPTEPGYYRAERPDYGGPVVVELLNRPQGQWVDAGDCNYLSDEDVRAIAPLVRLEPRAVTAKAVLDQVKTHALTDRSEYRLNKIASEFGVES